MKSQLYSEIGLYTNENMKKERLITSEVETGLNAIYPLVDNMLDNRVQGFDKVNKMFDLDIEVEFMSAWKNKEIIEDFSDVSDEDDDEILEDEELDQNVELDLELEED